MAASPIRGVTPILNVSSVPASIEWFEKLGWERGFTWNGAGEIHDKELSNADGPADFGSICAENATIFLCQDGQGRRSDASSPEGTWLTWWIVDKQALSELHDLAVSIGCQITHPLTEEPWGICEFHLQHPDGHVFRCSSGID
ncbi:MAG: bleomycin resistance family protein [bacterium]|nr:bleomycin resistance family protein [bacterium]